MISKLNKADLMYLLDKQEKLDSDIRKRFEIKDITWKSGMSKQHEIALRVEVSEFVNTAYKSWKYWKTKDMNYDDILEEAIDVIHFVMLQVNKSDLSIEENAVIMSYEIHNLDKLVNEEEVRETLYDMIQSYYSEQDILYKLLQVLDYYDFNTKQIMTMYNKKNEVNFKRLESGY